MADSGDDRWEGSNDGNDRWESSKSSRRKEKSSRRRSGKDREEERESRRTRDRHRDSEKRREKESRGSRKDKEKDRGKDRERERDDDRDRGDGYRHREDRADYKTENSSRQEPEEKSSSMETFDFGIPKAKVSRSGEEVSCSIEETNRIRAALGLKPLKLEKGDEQSAEQIAVDNMRKKKEEEGRQRELAEIEARIARARKKRALNEKLEGKRLGELAEGEQEIGSAADWVRRSRQKQIDQEEERLMAERRQRLLEEEEGSDEDSEDDAKKGKGKYGGTDLAGIEVAHDLKGLEAGGTVVMTLEDAEVLERDEHGVARGLADRTDRLMNVNLRDDERTKELLEKKRQTARGDYQGYDDAEFEEGAAIGPGARRAVLTKYDEQPGEKRAAAVLGAGGTVEASASSAGGAGGDAMDVDGEGAGGKRVLESLQVDLKMAQEYYTTEEAAARFKKRTKKGKTKKLRKKKKKEDIASIIAETERHEGTTSGKDHGSRKKRPAAAGGAEERAQAEAAAARFARAEERARDRFRAVEGRFKAREDAEDEFYEELDADLTASLARARRLAAKAERRRLRAAPAAAGGGPKEAAAAAAAVKEEEEEEEVGAAARAKAFVDATGGRVKAEEPTEDLEQFAAATAAGQVPSEAAEASADGNLVFTSTLEFTSRLQSRLEQRARDRAAAAAKAAEKEAAERAARRERRRASRREREGREGRDRAGAGPGARAAAGGGGGGEGEGGDGGVEEAKGEGAAAAAAAGDGWTKEGDEPPPPPAAAAKEEEDDDEESEEEEDTQLEHHAQPLASGGLAAALALARTTGDLSAAPVVQRLAGRAHDERDFHYEKAIDQKNDQLMKELGTREVKIEYRDEFGRELTRKEAFRQLSYKFHGHGPGQRKRDKRLKKVEEEKRAAAAFGGELESMKNLKKTQAATGQAHVVLGSGGAAGAAAGVAASISSEDAVARRQNRRYVVPHFNQLF